MSRHLEAVYERGVLRPVEPLSLAEHQRVHLILEEDHAKLSWRTQEAPNARKEELRWLVESSGAYAGEWVALEGAKLLAHGIKLAEVRATAISAGFNELFFARVPKSDPVSFAGW